MDLYFIAILPPEDIRQQIKGFKLEMAEKYGARHALKLPAHITLQSPFKLPEAQEEYLDNSLKNFAEGESAFDLWLNNFGRFPPRVLFVDVENKEPVIELQERLRQHLAKDFQMTDQDNSFHPHLTIATRDLQQKLFSAAWEEVKNRKYRAAFKVNHLTLMKHNGKEWEINSSFQLLKR